MYAYPSESDALAAAKLLLNEALRLDPAPLPEAVNAAWTVAGFALAEGVPLTVSSPAASLQHARDLARQHLEAIGDGTILRTVLPLIMPLVQQLLQIYLGGGASPKPA